MCWSRGFFFGTRIGGPGVQYQVARFLYRACLRHFPPVGDKVDDGMGYLLRITVPPTIQRYFVQIFFGGGAA